MGEAPDLGCCHAVRKPFPSGIAPAHAPDCPRRPGQKVAPAELDRARALLDDRRRRGVG